MPELSEAQLDLDVVVEVDSRARKYRIIHQPRRTNCFRPLGVVTSRGNWYAYSNWSRPGLSKAYVSINLRGQARVLDYAWCGYSSVGVKFLTELIRAINGGRDGGVVRWHPTSP